MQRYFVEFKNDSKEIKIMGDAVHHISHVMRMKLNDEFYVTNNEQVHYVKIKAFVEDGILCESLYLVKESNELPVFVSIAQGMPKGDKMDWIIQKTTELGVSEIVPILCERSLIKVDSDTGVKKVTRYEKIAIEAAEQSHRLKTPTIRPFMNIKELISYSEIFTYKIVAYETSDNNTGLKTILGQMKQDESIIIFIGPEGGIAPKELQTLQDGGFLTVSLGKRILRTETAPLFVMGCVVYEQELKG